MFTQFSIFFWKISQEIFSNFQPKLIENIYKIQYSFFDSRKTIPINDSLIIKLVSVGAQFVGNQLKSHRKS